MLEEPIFKESRRGKLDKGRLWAVSTEAKVAECLFLETSKKVVSLWTGSVAIPPRAGGGTRDFRRPSRKQGCRDRQAEEGVVGLGGDNDFSHQVEWAVDAGREAQALWFSVGSRPF